MVPFVSSFVSKAPGRSGLGWALACGLCLAASAATAAPAFVPVPPLDAPGYESGVRDVSDDGLATAGWSDSDEGVRATRWTAAGGPVSLGSWFMTRASERHSEANAISGDGATVVGWSRVDAVDTPQFPERRIAFFWTEATGFRVFPLSVGNEAFAVDVSADGTTIVGDSRTSTVHSFSVRFRVGLSPSVVGLPCCNPWVASTVAAVAAQSGQVVGGAFYLTFGGTRAGYRTDDLALIGSATSGEQIFPAAVTPDGSVVAGLRVQGTNDRNVFRWTEAGGFEDLGLYAPALNTRVLAVDATADTMVGEAGAPDAWQALLWRTGSGFEPLRDFATGELGLDLAGWTLVRANTITPDGNAIAGEGINPDGVAQGWVLYLEDPSGAPAVPLLSPAAGAALSLALVAAAFIAGRRAR